MGLGNYQQLPLRNDHHVGPLLMIGTNPDEDLFLRTILML